MRFLRSRCVPAKTKVVSPCGLFASIRAAVRKYEVHLHMIKHFYLLLLAFSAFGQSYKTTEVGVTDLISGTLFQPDKPSGRLVILIAGSGPTNRSGNQIGLHNNSLKYLAEALATNGTNVYAYDKRLFKLIQNPGFKEEDLTFDQFVDDARAVVRHFRKDYRKIIVAGHSEGSLIGMLAASEADGFISLAGPGQSADAILAEQLGKQLPGKLPAVKEKLALLREGKTFTEDDVILQSIFRASVQPYLISWFRYNPQTEVGKLKIPVLIVNGTKDIQVGESEARLLHQAKPSSTLAIIANMNHILKEIKGDDAENRASYNKPELPVMPELVSVVNQFLKGI